MSEKKKLHVMSEKIEKIWYLGGGQPVQGGLSRPHPGFLMVIFFSSPSFEPP